MPFVTCRFGSVKVVTGSRTEKRGYTSGLAKASFSWVESREMTAKPFISEPVAGSVITQPSGTAAATSASAPRMSHGSRPLNGIAAAMNFVPSRTEPPPTASRNFTRSLRASATARIRVS